MDRLGIINRITITLAIILYGVILTIQRRGFVELAYIGSIVFLISLFWFFVDKVGWKLPMLRSFLKAVPDVSGTWEGIYQRSDSEEPHEITMIIKQTWTETVIRSISSNADSISYTAQIVPVVPISNQGSFFELIFTWKAEAKDINNLGFEGTGGLWGTTVLLIDNDRPGLLEGHYYTNMRPNQTRGLIKLKKATANRQNILSSLFNNLLFITNFNIV